MWIADSLGFSGARIYAYDMATKQRDSAKDFDLLAAGNRVLTTSGRTAPPCGSRMIMMTRSMSTPPSTVLALAPVQTAARVVRVDTGLNDPRRSSIAALMQ